MVVYFYPYMQDVLYQHALDFFQILIFVMMEITSVVLYHKIDATETKQIIQL